MATYRITDPTTGRKLKLTGDSPPTEQELNEIFSNLGPAKQVAPPPSFMDQVSQVAKQAMAPQQFSPSSMLQQIPKLASQGAGKLGEVVSEDLAKRQVDPYTSAAVGTLISMGPDIALSGVNPLEGSPKTIPQMAIGAQRKALGFRIPELRLPFNRGQAARAAKVSLEQGVTSATGSPGELFSKATDLAAKSGQKLGAIRKSVGEQTAEPILKAIDDYKAVRLKGATGGKWDAIANKIEEAKDTVKGVLNKEGKASLSRIADAKKEIKDAISWTADKVSDRDAKAFAAAIEKGSEEILAKAGGDMKTYKALKPIYGAAKSMLKGLNREVAAQEGNNLISLPSLVAGAAGGPAAVAKIGMFELAKRRGAGIAASEIMGAANLPKTLGLPLATAASANIPAPSVMQSIEAAKVLTEDLARKYLKKALKKTGGDLPAARVEARKMAIKDGIEVPE